MPRRDEDGRRSLGPFTWKVEREDNHGDRSTTTTLSITRVTRWTSRLSVTRSWRDDDA
jgi:hypothetical protein